jgi:hypothetical protein
VQEGLREEEGQMREEKTQAGPQVRPRQQEDRQVMMRIRRIAIAASLVISAIVLMATGASPAFAETHPFLEPLGGSSSPDTFTNPNGIAIDESDGDVYVTDLGTDTVYRFDESGKPINFSAFGTYVKGSELTGTPAGTFSFPSAAYGTPAAIAVDNSKSPSDPSAGDLYVMDAGHGVIDKFSPSGEYLNQITGFTPATGSAEDELLGVAVDTNGALHADLNAVTNFREVAVDEFDDSSANNLIAEQRNPTSTASSSGVPEGPQDAHGFAVGPTGDDYLLYGACSCTAKLGQQLAGLGELDKALAGDVAVAADPATGHVYVDDQSSVSEWDSGAMNGNNKKGEGTGTLVSSFSRAGFSGSLGQGGIAVSGASGRIYVSNPAEGNVYIFGSDAPAVTAGAATSVTKEVATLNGTIDPRGTRVTSCDFEYGVADEFGRAEIPYEHEVSCTPQTGAIGAGTSSVTVSAAIGGLEPSLLYRFRLKAGNVAGSSESSGLLATAGVGFGVKNFQVSFLNEDGSPDTQAGSHPYELVNNIEFNSRFIPTESNADSPYIREPDGTVKNVAVNLPPGMAGDPNATATKCTLNQLDEFNKGAVGGEGCPKGAALGRLLFAWSDHLSDGKFFGSSGEPVYEMVAPRGTALQIGTNYINSNLLIDNGLLAGGDYPLQATIVNAPAAAPVLTSQLTVWGKAGQEAVREAETAVHEGREHAEVELAEAVAKLKPFLTLPTACNGPLRSTISVESYQGATAEKSYVTSNSAGTPVGLTGCSKLRFPPEISVAPDTTDASTSSGLTVGVRVPQTAAFNPNGLAESALRDTTVTLPEGVALNPAGADGLEACSAQLAGFGVIEEGKLVEFTEYEPGVRTARFTPKLPNPVQPGVNFCPDGSKIGTVKIKTPLLEHELEGSVYLASQNANPFGSLVALYVVAEDEHSGSLIKLTGEVKLSATGQIVATFENTPGEPFENFEMHMFGGERAPLSTPSRCGTYTTQASFVPWDGNGPVNTSSSFQIEHGPHGGRCPGASLPFEPVLTAGTTSIQAGGFSPFTMTMSREDGQQNLQSVSLKMPPGLSGLLTGVELCPEPQADEGLCGPNSLIGETTVSVGVGNDPFTVKGGKVYLTGPYRGAPFGLSIVNPAKAGPFDVEKDTSNPAYDPACDCIVVRAKIEVDPLTADLTITSDNEGPYKIPTVLDGIPLQIKRVNVTIDRSGFTFNPTNCSPMSISGSLHGAEGAGDALSVPFQATNCARLSFKPQFSVSTSGKTSRKSGASLHVKLVYPKLPFGSQANIASVKVDLPRQLPSRLTTLQKACVAAVFAANPGGCPADSRVGTATATTPLLPVPLSGPAYFVSHGGAKFPELVIVLQGYGVTVDLHSETFIDKSGITSSTFRTIPDVPVGTFELTLPEGSFSALAANGNLCKATRTALVKRKVKVTVKGRTRTVTRKVRETLPASLQMPTAFTAQNGAVIHESTPISVTGCSSAKKAKKSRKAK